MPAAPGGGVGGQLPPSYASHRSAAKPTADRIASLFTANAQYWPPSLRSRSHPQPAIHYIRPASASPHKPISRLFTDFISTSLL